jgi:hypothetical protein
LRLLGTSRVPGHNLKIKTDRAYLCLDPNGDKQCRC